MSSIAETGTTSRKRIGTPPTASDARPPPTSGPGSGTCEEVDGEEANISENNTERQKSRQNSDFLFIDYGATLTSAPSDCCSSVDPKTETGCWTWYLPKRYIVTLLLGVGMLLVYAQRTNLGVTVVMILDDTAHEKVNSLEFYHNLPRLPWSSRKVGFLHAAFYMGFFVTQLPGAYFTTSWPCHKLYGGCILISAILNLLLPVCLDHGQYGLTCLIRLAQGSSEGLLYPTCFAVLRHWSAPCERSRQVTSVLTCAYAGAIVGFPVAGLITNYVGWQYIFYMFGGSCIVWYLLWLCLVYEKPVHHTSIREAELIFMLNTQGADTIDYENFDVPLRAIVTSLPVLAICFCHFTRHWVFALMLTNEPLYLNEFGFNIAETGVYAAIPHVAMVILSFTSGIVADCFLNAATMTTTTVRKLLTCGGLGAMTICLIVLTFLNTGGPVIIVLTLAYGVFGLSTSGWGVNHYDLSTRHASILVAVTSTYGTLGSIIVPLAVGALTEKQDLASWNSVFYLTTAIVLASDIFFLLFGSGEKQSWSEPPANTTLVQKTDPLALKPYRIHSLTKPTKSDPHPLVPTESLGPGTVSAQQLTVLE